MRDGEASIPDVCIERGPVAQFGLGIFGFDHLSLTFVVTDEARFSQDRWFVLEGVRDFEPVQRRAVLGVVGWDGGTTLSDANGGRQGRELSDHIGTPRDRGHRCLARGRDAVKTWSTLVATAGDIVRSGFPYIAYAREASPLPTLNSSSLISSLLFHAGFDYAATLPYGLRVSPGLSTLLASSGDDHISMPEPFDAVLGGGGNDVLTGRNDPAKRDKLYGGTGNDAFGWSAGPGVIHGGEPGLPYAEDGDDTVSYAGAGPVTIVGHQDATAHVRPDFTATFQTGSDELFSIERLVWDDRSDRITVGPGVGLIRSSLSLSTFGGHDWVDARSADVRLTVSLGDGEDVVLAGAAPLSVETGPGRDVIVLTRPGAEVELQNAGPDDRLDILWAARSASMTRDARTPGDAVITIIGETGTPSHVRVHGFRPGDLGICSEPPANVPLGALTLSGPACEEARHGGGVGGDLSLTGELQSF